MILSSDELQVLEYLKSYKGSYVSMVEICRSAAGRQKFKESPNWATSLMSRLVDEHLAVVNERGHYAYKMEAENTTPIVEDYFTGGGTSHNAQIVGDDYFSPLETMPSVKPKQRWVSPQIATILKKAGRKPGRKSAKPAESKPAEE